MIKFSDGELLDLLSSPMKESPDWMAWSYALKMAILTLFNNLSKISMAAAIDELPEYLLDYLAEENRAPYYDESMDVEKKREMVKGALQWRMEAGTTEALQKVIKVMFEDGDVVERPKYAGEPHHFFVRTGYALDSPELLDKFRTVVDSLQRETAVLDTIEFAQSGRTMLYAASANLAMEIIAEGITKNRV